MRHVPIISNSRNITSRRGNESIRCGANSGIGDAGRRFSGRQSEDAVRAADVAGYVDDALVLLVIRNGSAQAFD